MTDEPGQRRDDEALAARIAETDRLLEADPNFECDLEDDAPAEEEVEVTFGGWIPGAPRRDTA